MEPVVSPTDELATAAEQLAAVIVPAGTQPLEPDWACEKHVIEARLGVAASLFSALRHKHAPTAAHSLRVALGCSSWAFALGTHSDERDELEVAALLHDIGKIGAPDAVLLKPGPLALDEARLMEQYRRSSCD